MNSATLEESFSYCKHFTDSSLELPDTLQLEVTRRCNLKCRFCPLTVENSKRRHKPHDMTLGDIRRIEHLLQTASSVELTGFGEMFMHPDIFTLLRTFRSYNLAIFGTTNGQLVTPEISETLIKEQLIDVLTFSIDAAEKQMYQDLRGADWNRLLENLEAIKSIKEKQEKNLLHVWFSFLAMRKNIDQLADFIELASSYGADRVILQHIFENQQYPDQNCFRDVGQLASALLKASEKSRQTGVFLDVRNLSFASEGSLPVESELMGRMEEAKESEMLIKTCPFPWNHTFIQADGTVSACAMVWEGLDIGNLNDRSFFEIWRGERYGRLRNRMLSVDFPDPCFACQYFGWRKPVFFDEITSKIEMTENVQPQLGEGWHAPDVDPWGKNARWTRKKATVFLKNDQSRMLRIHGILHPSTPYLEGAVKVAQWPKNGKKPLMPPARFQIDSHDFWGEPLLLPLPSFEGELLQVDIAFNRTWNPKGGMELGYRNVGLLVYQIGLQCAEHEIKNTIDMKNDRQQLGQGWLAPEKVSGHTVRWMGWEATALIKTEKNPLVIEAMLPGGLQDRKIRAYLDGERLGEAVLPNDGAMHRLAFSPPPYSPKTAVLQIRCSQALPAPGDDSAHPRLFGALIGSISF